MKEIDIDDITGYRDINFNFKCPQCCGEVSGNIPILKPDIQGESKATRVKHESTTAYCTKCNRQYQAHSIADVFEVILHFDDIDDEVDVKWELQGKTPVPRSK
jgi:hypothetical protein